MAPKTRLFLACLLITLPLDQLTKRWIIAEFHYGEVLPVIEGLRRHSSVPLSIDTSKAGVMRLAAASGADVINDVTALRGIGSLDAARDTGLAVVLMHMQGEPRTMQRDP